MGLLRRCGPRRDLRSFLNTRIYRDFYLRANRRLEEAGTIAIWGLYDNLLAKQPVPQSVAEGIKAGWLEFALCSFFCRTLSAPG
jgi:hypothetical protein